ncbi:MAG: hypothetical protein FJY86_01730 [Candidatus Diapherotrites archaeon]|uniref:Uncharacterized protein n=1 Tax=Candidatus Iainarchaeum sp. TaxID=3101447 RepID=A0A8T4C785_9ARCH|nr:hypothetical protein [Candidatus Diapherotrites archaeon]
MFHSSFLWVAFIGLFVSGVWIEWLDREIVLVDYVSDALALPNGVRFLVQGEVFRPRVLTSALVFDISNRGVMTCYYRHPPESLFLFSHDWVVVRASLVSTINGRLCVVSSLEALDAP